MGPRFGAVAALLVLAACPSPAPVPVRPQPAGPPPAAPADAAAPSQDEQLAAIQKAMNELDEASQTCWAAAAVERFDIEGELTARIEIGDGSAKVSVVQDSTRTPRLAACVVAVLTGYRWAPPLRGQTIQLPFKFRAPDGQNLIDRALVPWNGQGKISIAVLLDEHNTGNPSVSMIELAIAAGGTTTARTPERPELWYFLGPATVSGTAVAAGDMMFIRAGGAREIKAPSTDAVHAVLVLVPGGAEGAARAGALPTPSAGTTKRTGPVFLSATKAKTYGPSTIYAEPSSIGEPTLSASVLTLKAGASVAEHVHAKETEVLYLLEGSGTMTIKGVAMAVTPTSVIQIPANTKHAFTATSAVRALQIYTPAGPEQRFKGTP
ncbi:MAG: cupin domain-containing protein [Deltaproteobacteria bacterium]|nr:cupin domain-containing protein [Deltaproteobacteria bacterium]